MAEQADPPCDAHEKTRRGFPPGRNSSVSISRLTRFRAIRQEKYCLAALGETGARHTPSDEVRFAPIVGAFNRCRFIVRNGPLLALISYSNMKKIGRAS